MLLSDYWLSLAARAFAQGCQNALVRCKRLGSCHNHGLMLSSLITHHYVSKQALIETPCHLNICYAIYRLSACVIRFVDWFGRDLDLVNLQPRSLTTALDSCNNTIFRIRS